MSYRRHKQATMRTCSPIVALAWAAQLACRWQPTRATATSAFFDQAEQHCDVLIAGGSTAALSAALTAAAAGGSSVAVCLTEPTDELGGQLAFNPAIDYGHEPNRQSSEWASLVANITSERSPCWVSRSCYPPSRLAVWIRQRTARFPNLHVLLRTTVRAAVRDESTGRVMALTLVTRTPTNTASGGWNMRLSEALTDWYDPEPSKHFTKHARNVTALIVVEATELGDVLATARLPHTQGVEIPTEESITTDDGISQAACFTFYMELLPKAPSHPDPAPLGNAWTSAGAHPYWGAPPEGSCCCGKTNALADNAKTCPKTIAFPDRQPLHGSCLWPQQCSWAGVWSYRRSTRGSGPALLGTGMNGVNVGDVAMINWGHGNDMAAANLYLPSKMAAKSVDDHAWVSSRS